MISTHCFSSPNPLTLFPPPPSPRRLPLSLSSSSNRQYAYTSSVVRLFAATSPTGPASAVSGESCRVERDRLLARLSASAVFIIGLGALSWTGFGSGHAIANAAVPVSGTAQGSVAVDKECENTAEDGLESEELRIAFEKWKSKTFSLTVPLRIVSLRGSVPPSWIKDFVQCQGKRTKLRLEVRGSLEGIFSEISASLSKGKADPKSVAVADLVTIGDTWLNVAINKAMIEPIQAAEYQDWFKSLPEKWKVHLCRNREGIMDPKGQIWAVPYRWGSMVIMYKKSKLRKQGIAPIEDWSDLWRPELAGKIAMVDSPREVIGAVLKYMGASYNTKNISKEVPGGINAVQHNLAALAKQVRLFDSFDYLKAFTVGDVWVAVGWSNDILPAAKRTPDVGVIVPKSGSSLWADLWAIPAGSKCATEKIGGRVRGPSPLIHQWLEFCLQPAREVPFKQEVVHGASPSWLGQTPSKEESKALTKGAPKLETNLVSGVPPPEILAKCEFLQPLSEDTVAEYEFLISQLQNRSHGFAGRIRQSVS
ncbi:hypothetical protein V2J09_003078 [Rumex salicifolius]